MQCEGSVGDIPSPHRHIYCHPSAIPNAKSQEYHCFSLWYILQDFEERKIRKDSDNHCRGRETQSISLELKLLKSNWSVGKKEQRIEYIYQGTNEQAKGIYVGRQHMEKGEIIQGSQNHHIIYLILRNVCEFVYTDTHMCTHRS